jgi:hypothetical protein
LEVYRSAAIQEVLAGKYPKAHTEY